MGSTYIRGMGSMGEAAFPGQMIVDGSIIGYRQIK